MLFVFSGMPLTRQHWSPYQWMDLTRQFGVDKVYLRDPRRAWYQLGLDPHTDAVDDTAAFLLGLIVEREPRRIVSIGVSSGGFGALLFGYLLGVDEVHAFAPRTYVDIDNRLKNDDFRMDEFIEDLYRSPRAQPEYFDLRPLFHSGRNPKTRFYIHFAADSRLDVANAAHLADAPNVFLVAYESGGHQIARALRENGALEAIIADALADRTKPPAPNDLGAVRR